MKRLVRRIILFAVPEYDPEESVSRGFSSRNRRRQDWLLGRNLASEADSARARSFASSTSADRSK